MITWKNWLAGWRNIAEKSTLTEYQPIVWDESGYEVLRVSRYDNNFDGDKSHIKHTISEFNDHIVWFSRATRDLGIVRVITNRGEPTFVIEPGGEVIEWRAEKEGVSVTTLMRVMRAGDFGRRVRRRDRMALKNSHAEWDAKKAELEQELQNAYSHNKSLEYQSSQLQYEKTEAVERESKMRKNLISHNEQQDRQGVPTPKSDPSLACALGKAQDKGAKLTSNYPLPGHFGG